MDMTGFSGCEIAIVGGGIAGLVAASEAASRGSTVTLFEGAGVFGGLVFNVGALDDYPAPGILAGSALAEALQQRAVLGGCTVISERIAGLEPSAQGYLLRSDTGRQHAARTVILSTGARLRQLGVPGEAELAGRGVSQCDWCDGGFFRNEEVAVIGGGDSALQAALHLAKTCSRVTVIVRGADARARQAYLARAADEPHIEFLWETRVVEICGSERVTGLRLESADRFAPQSLDCSGVFVFAGIEPNAECAPSTVERDAAGALRTGDSYETAAAGLYAIGAVRSGHRGGLAAVIGEAAVAAAAASERVKSVVN